MVAWLVVGGWLYVRADSRAAGHGARVPGEELTIGMMKAGENSPMERCSETEGFQSVLTIRSSLRRIDPSHAVIWARVQGTGLLRRCDLFGLHLNVGRKCVDHLLIV